MTLLDIGAGAGEGLEALLSRERLQQETQQRQQQIDEEQRSNKAREALEKLRLADSMQERSATAAGTAQNRAFTQAKDRVGGYAIGQSVPTDEVNQDVKSGAVSPTLFQSPPMGTLNMIGASTLPGPPSEGPMSGVSATSPNQLVAPSPIQMYTGTGKELEQKATADRLEAAAKAKASDEPLVPVNVGGKPILTPRSQAVGKEAFERPSAAQTAAAAPDADVITSRPSGPGANKPDPKAGGLTPNAVYQSAVDFALTGRPPSVGLGAAGAANLKRNAISNAAGALAAAAGVDLPTLQAKYRANAGTLNKLLPQATATANASRTASDNLDLAASQSDQVTRSGSKLANRYLQWAQGSLTPAAGLTQFEVYIYTAAREYAKVTSGGAGSAQGLTDSASKEAEKLLSATQSPDAFSAAVDAMKHDMSNVVSEQAAGIAGVDDTIGNFFAAVNGVTPSEKPAGNSLPGMTGRSGAPPSGGLPPGVTVTRTK